MENHPPLGKLLIAAGEALFKSNEQSDQFLDTEHAPTAPAGFSFAGYRFFPVLLAWLSCPIFFLLVLTITSQPIWALFLSFFVIFDNALIVHSRGAMLEGVQFFFFITALLCMTLVVRKKSASLWPWVCFGVSTGLAVATKLNALVLLVALPCMLWQTGCTVKQKYLACGLSFFLFVAVQIVIWQIHFSLASQVNPKLPDEGWFQASSSYRDIVKRGENGDIRNFPRMYIDSLGFVSHYNHGVPQLNLCKADENGSPPWLWPLGARSINYRWERHNDLTQFLYLQVNPVIWWVSAAGLLLAVLFVAAKIAIVPQIPLPGGALLVCFLAQYAVYMTTMLSMSRVMYLYHYFLPLVLCFCIVALLLSDVRELAGKVLSYNAKTYFLLSVSALSLLTFMYFGPLTYYEPLTPPQVAQRAWLSLWDLHCEHCPRTNGFAVPFTQK